MSNIERDVLALVETYLPLLLPEGMVYSPEASEVLHRALVRDYVEDKFSMRKHIDSPFTEAKGFQLHASYNERDFRVPERDMLDHLQTFDATALPRKPFKFWAAACVYPLPPLIMANWVKDSNDQWIQDGECDGNKGNWSFAILYFNELPVMDWVPPTFEANDLPPNSYYAREARWHEGERNGTIQISDYLRNTQLPHDARVFAERRRKGIPLTPYQERVMEAGGWPYPKEPQHEQDDRMGSGAGVGSGARAADGDASGGQRDTAAAVGGAAGDGHGVSGGVADDEELEPIYPDPNLPKLWYPELVQTMEDYCFEEPSDSDHAVRWRRAMAGFGQQNGHDPMTAAEAQTYADRGWKRWVPVAEALREIEKGRG